MDTSRSLSRLEHSQRADTERGYSRPIRSPHHARHLHCLDIRLEAARAYRGRLLHGLYQLALAELGKSCSYRLCADPSARRAAVFRQRMGRLYFYHPRYFCCRYSRTLFAFGGVCRHYRSAHGSSRCSDISRIQAEKFAACGVTAQREAFKRCYFPMKLCGLF